MLSERDARRRVYDCREGVTTNGAALQIAVTNQARAGLLIARHAPKFTPSALGFKPLWKSNGYKTFEDCRTR